MATTRIEKSKRMIGFIYLPRLGRTCNDLTDDAIVHCYSPTLNHPDELLHPRVWSNGGFGIPVLTAAVRNVCLPEPRIQINES